MEQGLRVCVPEAPSDAQAAGLRTTLGVAGLQTASGLSGCVPGAPTITAMVVLMMVTTALN